jgi:hypothetical protein
MWLELTDTRGHRTLVNMDLVVSLKDTANGNTIIDTSAGGGGSLHSLTVREDLEQILRAMEDKAVICRSSRPAASAHRQMQHPDFVSDGNEG